MYELLAASDSIFPSEPVDELVPRFVETTKVTVSLMSSEPISVAAASCTKVRPALPRGSYCTSNAEPVTEARSVPSVDTTSPVSKSSTLVSSH